MPVAVKTAGGSLEGWQSVDFSRSIDSLAGSFSLSVSARWGLTGAAAPFSEGDAVTISYQRTPRMVGYIDQLTESVGPESYELAIAGRDKTGDLIDCTPPVKPSEYRNVTLPDFARRLCEPHGIEVIDSLALTTKKTFSVPVGSAIFETLDSYASQQGALMRTTDEGALEFYRPGLFLAPVTLAYGENIREASYSADVSGLFSKYEAHGQGKRTKNSGTGSAANLKPQGVTDPDYSARARLLVVQETNATTAAQLKSRAEWERRVRRGRAGRLSVTVDGWKVNSYTFSVGDLVNIEAPELRVNGQLLLAGYSLRYDSDSGEVMDMDFALPGAYDTQPQVSKKAKKQAGGNWRLLPQSEGGYYVPA